MQPDRSARWLETFLRARDLQRPDGRPLWRYRTTSQEFEELGQELKEVPQPEDLVQAAVSRVEVAQALTLFAAEFWRRHDVPDQHDFLNPLDDESGGSWAPLLDVLRTEDFGALLDPIEIGLRGWRRPLIRNRQGRQHLGSLLVEGGWSSRVLQENAGLLRYFKHLLHHRDQLNHGSRHAALAEAIGRDTLPSKLRRLDIFRLGLETVSELWRLQREGDITITALESREPDWRAGFPIGHEEKADETLFEPLLAEANRLSGATAKSVRISRWLEQRGDVFSIEAQLEMPEELERQPFADLLSRGVEELPSRTRILLQLGDGNRLPVAVVNEIQTLQGALLRLEPFGSSTGFRFAGRTATGQFALWFGEGSSLVGPKELAGGHLPSALPWIFSASEDEDLPWGYLTSGSVNTPRKVLRVAVAEDWRVMLVDGRADEIGKVSDRAVYEISGRCRLYGPSGATVTLRTGQNTDSRTEYRLVGRREIFGAERHFFGVPSLWVCDEDGRIVDRVNEVEWRPVGTEQPWRALDRESAEKACLGRVWLRIVDRDSLRLLEEVTILPADFELGSKPGARHQGTLLLDGVEGAELSLVSDQQLEHQLDWEGSTARLNLKADGKAPATVNLRLTWNEERQLELTVPFPSRRGRFIGRDGVLLAIDQQISVGRLSGVRAIVSSIDEDEKFFINAHLVAGEDLEGEVEQHLGHSEEIPRIGTGRYELDLGHLQETFRRLLSSSPELEASLHLRIESDRSILPPCPIHVGRFEAPLKFDEKQGLVRFPEVIDQNNGRVEAVPLWQPEVQPIRLERKGNAFHFGPERRESGPWMLLGWDGDWCRFRPLLWEVGAEGEANCEAALSDLQQAMRAPTSAERQIAFDATLDELTEDLSHPDWQQITACIARQDMLPGGIYELLRALVRRPEAAVSALFVAPRDERSRTWRVLEDLPFVWRLLPLRAWRRTAERYLASVRDPLRAAGARNAETVAINATREILNDLAQHRPFLRAITDWLKVVVLGEGPSQELGFPSMVYEGLLEDVRQDLLRRAEDRWWPHSVAGFGDWLPHKELPAQLRLQIRRTRDKAGYTHATLQAPLLAAFASVLGIASLPERFLFITHRLREFDSRFFDNTYEFGLRYALAVALEEQWESLG